MVGIRTDNRVLRIYEYLHQRFQEDVPMKELQAQIPRGWTASTVLRQLALTHGATIEVTVAYGSGTRDCPTRYFYGQYVPVARPRILTAKLVALAKKPVLKTRGMSELERS